MITISQVFTLQEPRTMMTTMIKYLLLMLMITSSLAEYCEHYCTCQESPLISVTCINAELKVKYFF